MKFCLKLYSPQLLSPYPLLSSEELINYPVNKFNTVTVVSLPPASDWIDGLHNYKPISKISTCWKTQFLISNPKCIKKQNLIECCLWKFSSKQQLPSIKPTAPVWPSLLVNDICSMYWFHLFFLNKSSAWWSVLSSSVETIILIAVLVW